MTEFEPAPNWRRLAAIVYDSLIILAISMAYGGLVTGVSVAIYGSPNQDYQPMFNSPLFGMGWLLSIGFFYCFFWRTKGQTVGMKAWRLKVIPIDANNACDNISWRFCVIRALAGGVGLVLLGLNYWYRWINPKQDCLHDRLSRSRVIVMPKPQRNDHRDKKNGKAK